MINFSFEHENPTIDSSLKLIQGMIFFELPKVEILMEYQQQNKHKVKKLLSSYDVTEEAPEEEDP